MIVAGGVAVPVSYLQSPVYEASAILFVTRGVDDYEAEFVPAINNDDLARTYTILLTSRPVIEETMSRLGITSGYDDLLNSLKVEAIPQTQLIQMLVENGDPQTAVALVRTMSEVFVEQNENQQLARFADSRENLMQEIELVDAQIQEAQQQLDELEAGNTPNDQIREAQTTLSQYRQSRIGLVQNFENLRLMEAVALDRVDLMEVGLTSNDPIRPQPALNIALATIFGMLVGLGVIFSLEYFDETIRSAEAIKEELGLPVIASVARFGKGQDGLVAQTAPQSPTTEALRSLRTNLQYSSLDKPLRRILFTSVQQNDGKSTVVSNLAVVMAKTSHKVAVVDADLRQPGLHQLFEMGDHQGLTDVILAQPLQLDGALRETKVNHLLLMSSGKQLPNPAELLSTNRMSLLLAAIDEKVDVMLIDSPDLLHVADALVLANQVDGVVLVLEYGKVNMADALEAKAQLERVGANVLGVVMNKVPVRRGNGR